MSDRDFMMLYGLYLAGQNLYQIADAHWQQYYYASSESFRLSFRARCIRKGLPLRDVSASRRKPPPQESRTIRGMLTSEGRQYLRERVSERQKQIRMMDKRVKVGSL
jgi:hypothetical protein